MIARPEVSVVIPTYNYGHFIVEAIQSVLVQTYSNVEIIVVDDGSIDDTARRLTGFRDRIRYIRQPNQGVSAARNRGILAAKGEFVGFLDADDKWHPQFLERLIPVLAARHDVALVGSGRSTDAECLCATIDEGTPVSDVPVEWLLTRHPLAPSAVVIRRSIFDVVGGFDTKCSGVADRDMWIRIAFAGRLAIVHARLAWYRIHGSSMSAPSNTRKMELDDLYVLRKAFASRSLRGRLILRCQAISMVNSTAAISYREARQFARAWRCGLASLAWWPLPYTGGARQALRNFLADPAWPGLESRQSSRRFLPNAYLRLRFLASTFWKQLCALRGAVIQDPSPVRRPREYSQV